MIAHDSQRAHSVSRTQNRRFGKRLGDEIYVASEASATPLQNYAPQISLFEHDLPGKPVSTFPDHVPGNFSALRCVSPPWTLGNEVLSSPDIPRPSGSCRRNSLPRWIATKHLISDGFSS
jgi:hypothetical protein